MHAAPPVRVSLGRSVGCIAWVSVCVGIATANAAAWVLLRNDAPVAIALVAGLGAAALIAWGMRRAGPAVDLHWNGAEWQWRGQSGHALVALDLDAWMLLRFDAQDGRRCWIAASRRSSTGPWPALRAALYARRPTDPLAAPPA